MKKVNFILIAIAALLLMSCGQNIADTTLNANEGSVTITVCDGARVMSAEWNLSSVTNWKVSFTGISTSKAVENVTLPSTTSLPAGEYKIVLEGDVTTDWGTATVSGESTVTVKAGETVSSNILVDLKKSGTCPSFTFTLEMSAESYENLGEQKTFAAILYPLFGDSLENIKELFGTDEGANTEGKYSIVFTLEPDEGIPSGYYVFQVCHLTTYGDPEYLDIGDSIVELVDGVAALPTAEWEYTANTGYDASFYATTDSNSTYNGVTADYPMYIDDLLQFIRKNYQGENVYISLDSQEPLCLDVAHLTTGATIQLCSADCNMNITDGDITIDSANTAPELTFTTSDSNVTDVTLNFAASADSIKINTLNGVELTLMGSSISENLLVDWDGFVPSNGVNVNNVKTLSSLYCVDTTAGYKAYVYLTSSSGTDEDTKLTQIVKLLPSLSGGDYSTEQYGVSYTIPEVIASAGSFAVSGNNIYIFGVGSDQSNNLYVCSMKVDTDTDGAETGVISVNQTISLKDETNTIDMATIGGNYLYLIEHSYDWTIKACAYKISGDGLTRSSDNDLSYTIYDETTDIKQNLSVNDAYYSNNKLYMLISNGSSSIDGEPTDCSVYQEQGGVLIFNISARTSELYGWEKELITQEIGAKLDNDTITVTYTGPAKDSTNYFNPTYFYAIKPTELKFEDYGYYIAAAADNKIARYRINRKYTIDLENATITKDSDATTFVAGDSNSSTYWAKKDPAEEAASSSSTASTIVEE